MSVETHELTMLAADARKMPLEDGSVQCIVTSPPYWGLRKYAGEQELIWPNGTRTQGIVCCNRGDHSWIIETKRGISGGMNQGDKTENPDGATNRPVPASEHGTCELCGAWRGAYGLEPTIEMYIAHTVEILRECRRVLRSDGVLFWNVGDSYAGGGNVAANYPGDYPKQNSNRGCLTTKGITKLGLKDGCKPKDLCLIPARVALAAQADGWWVRSLIIWSKPNPMPESVTDRPTDSYEHIIMLTKSARYFWDADAVREPSTSEYTAARAVDAGAYSPGRDERDGKERFCSGTGGYVPAGGRNMRNVWNFPTQPYAGAHFATFPEEIPRRAILAATSARGCCTQCAAPWERVTRPSDRYAQALGATIIPHNGKDLEEGRKQTRGENPQNRYRDEFGCAGAEYLTIGFRPTCRCRGQRGRTAPCVVLDPFGGSGTTGRVAIELGRRAVLLDIAYSAEYAPLAAARTSNVQRSIVW